MKKSYIKPSQEAGRSFFSQQKPGKVVMLNLLKFREVADYTASPELAPDAPISGWEAYQLYIAATLPLLEKAESEVIYSGKADQWLIGPSEESWDLALLVEHESADRFLAFASDEAYLKTAGHRTAALEDSRLLPIYNK